MKTTLAIFLLLTLAFPAMAGVHIAKTASGRIVTLAGHTRAAAVRVSGSVADINGDYCATDPAGIVPSLIIDEAGYGIYYRVEGLIVLFRQGNPGDGDFLALNSYPEGGGNVYAFDAYSRTANGNITLSGPWSNGVTVEVFQ